MFSSAKLALITIGMYTIVVLLPGAFLESVLFPPEYVRMAMVACVLFMLGVCGGAVLFPFREPRERIADGPTLRRGLAWTVAAEMVLAAYVFAAGPTSPLLAALTTEDALEIAWLREEAVKLNADPVFVIIYSWARDVFAPIAFVLGVQVVRTSRSRQYRWLAGAGIVVAAALGLWSGQKATVVNYLLAAVIYSAASAWSMARQLIKVVPVLLLAVLAIFAITLPQFFTAAWDADGATDRLAEAIIHRVLLSPLDLAAAYVYSVDTLQIIAPHDVLPLGVFATPVPDLGSVENRIGLEFFYSGIDSISANGLAFAYAFVLAGYVGCVLAGLLIVGAYKAGTWLVHMSGSAYMNAVYAALLSYHTLDLLNGNWVTYLTTAGRDAILCWLIGSLIVRGPARGPVRPRDPPPGMDDADAGARAGRASA